MKFYYPILFFICSFFGNNANGQPSIIVLENLLTHSTENNFKQSYDSIAAAIDKMPLNEAIDAADKLLRLSAGLPHYKTAFNRLTGLIEQVYKKNDYKQVLLYYLSVMDEPVFNKPEIQQTILCIIGSFYYQIGDGDNAKYYLEKYLSIPVDTMEARAINILTTIGFICRGRNDFSNAESYLKRALALAELKQDREWIGLASGNLGETYYLMGRYKEAVPLLLKDIAISLSIKSFESAAGSYATIGALYLKDGHTQKAKGYLDSAVILLDIHAAANRLNKMRAKAYRGLSDYYLQAKEYELAHRYLLWAWNIHDSIKYFTSKEVSRLNVAEISTAKNEQNLLLLRSTIESKKKNEQLFIVIIAAIVFILAFTFFILKQNQKINHILQEKNDSVLKEKAAVEERENELEKSNQTKNKLFSIIAHDLRTPMGNLQGLLSMTNQGLIDKDVLPQYLPDIQAKVETLSGTIDNLLNWTYSQMDGISINASSIDLPVLTNKVFDFLHSIASRKNIQLDNRVTIGTKLWADKNQIEIVIRNLVSNAIKFSNENNTVIVSAETTGNKVVVAVTDFGIGIKDGDIANIFHPYTAVSTTGTKGEKGVGLGLIICKEFILNNNGGIWVEQNRPNGAVFKFELPNSGLQQ